MLLTAARTAAVVLAGALGVGIGVGGAVPLPSASAGAVAEGEDCANADVDAEPTDVEGTNTPYERLRIAAAHEWLAADIGVDAGSGVDVVVVDAGVPGAVSNEVAPSYGGEARLGTSHGAVVAGIIAGADQRADGSTDEVPIGIAPAARVHSMRIYEAMGSGDGATDVFDPNVGVLVEGLDEVAAGIARGAYGTRTVVIIPFTLPPVDDLTAPLRAALDAVAEAGGLLVASAGDRPPADAVTGAMPIGPGEDAAGSYWPAAFGSVIAVGVDPGSGEGRAVSDVVPPNSDIDLVAPAGDGVSRGLNGAPCVVGAYSTDWAAAAVAGVAALVWSGHLEEDASQIRQRLLQSADGNGASGGRFSGYGVVQPLAALQRRPGAWTEKLGRDRADQQPAIAPERPADVLAVTRRNAVWWGLVGGGALAIALILRPVLARRRSR